LLRRFGDVKKLITQTLDPLLSAFFRDVAHKKTMLQLLQERDAIQGEARNELRRKFLEFDISCVDVLIGKPGTGQADGRIDSLLEQLRLRQLSIEQMETYDRQKAAAEKQRTYNEAQAVATKQTELTNSQVQIRIAENQGEADLMRVRKSAEADLARTQRQAEMTVVTANADLERSRRAAEQVVVTAEAESRKAILAGRGEAAKAMQVGLTDASVLTRKIQSFGDPRLYALALVADHLAHSKQPLVPERVFVAGGSGENGGGPSTGHGLLGMLINLLVAEKAGFSPAEANGHAAAKDAGPMQEFADRMAKEATASVEDAMAVLGKEKAALTPAAR
jgi:uncharacterized membrane protein YqiK